MEKKKGKEKSPKKKILTTLISKINLNANIISKCLFRHGFHIVITCWSCHYTNIHYIQCHSVEL